MTEKEFYTQKDFAHLLGLSPAAISKAISSKKPRLQRWKATGQIYINDPLTQAFIKNVPRERLQTTVIKKTNGESSPELTSDTITQAIESKAIEE